MEQIDQEKTKLVSKDGRALNERLAELNEIETNILFLKELYKTTLASSESNRIDSLQQQRFIALISKPIKPDMQWYYWRHRGFITYIMIIIISSSLSKFILGIAERHND